MTDTAAQRLTASMIANLSPCQHWLDRAVKCAEKLAQYAAKRQASPAECEKLAEMAVRVFPILLWKIDHDEVEKTPSNISMMALLVPFGISTSALQRIDIPMGIRQALLPLLRPDCSRQVMQWWDNHAAPTWIAPWLTDLEPQEFDALFDAPGSHAVHGII